MTRVLIATKEPVLAKGLEAILVAGGLEVSAICADIFELFESLDRRRPDVAILDLPILPGPEVIRELRRFAPKCQFVLWPRQAPTRQVNDAVRCGARGVLAPGASPARFVEAMNMIADFSQPAPPPAELVNLACDPMEREFIALVGYGLSSEELAAAIGSDEATVNRMLKTLAQRLGAEDRYELALYGLSTLNNEYNEPRP